MRKTRIFAALLCLMMIATAIPMMPASAEAVTETEAGPLAGFRSYKDWDFSAACGTVGYYEYYVLSQKINDKNYQEKVNKFGSDTTALGTASVANGVLTLTAGDKREGQTAQYNSSTAFGEGVTATAYPAVKYT